MSSDKLMVLGGIAHRLAALSVKEEREESFEISVVRFKYRTRVNKFGLALTVAITGARV